MSGFVPCARSPPATLLPFFIPTILSRRRCPFLDPVKSKHAYRVPRGGVPTTRAAPACNIASDAAPLATLLYSSVANSRAKKAKAAAERDRRAAQGLSKGGGQNGASGERASGPLVVEMPPSFKVRSTSITMHAKDAFLHEAPGRTICIPM